MRKHKIIKSLIIPASIVAFLPPAIIFSAKDKNTSNNKSSHSLSTSKVNVMNENEVKVDDLGQRIFKNYSPKYMFAFYQDEAAFKREGSTESAKFVAKINFGINMEYLGTVWADARLNDSYKNIQGRFKNRTTLTEENLRKNFDNMLSAFWARMGEETTKWLAPKMLQLMQQGYLFFAPQITRALFESDPETAAKMDQTGVFNQIIADPFHGSKRLVVNKYFIDEPNDFWPHSKNVAWIINNYDDKELKEKSFWDAFEKEGQKLKWKQIYDDFQVYDPGFSPSTKIYKDPLDTELITEQVKELIFSNLDNQFVDFKIDNLDKFTSPFTVIKTTNVKIQSLINAENNRSTIVQINLPVHLDEELFKQCKNLIKNTELKIHKADSCAGLNYFSIWYKDLFCVSYQDSVAKLKRQYPTKYNLNYVIPHQLVGGDSVLHTKDRITGADENPILFNFYAPEYIGYKFPDSSKHRLIAVGNRQGESTPGSIGLWHNGAIYQQIKSEFPTITDADVQQLVPNGAQSFTYSNFNQYLFSLPITKVKSFFDTGKLDTKIYYQADEKDIPEGKQVGDVKYNMWGEIKVLDSSGKEIGNAKSFIIDVLDNEHYDEAREKLDKWLSENVSHLPVIQPASNTSYYFTYALPDLTQESEPEIFNGKSDIYGSFTTKFYFKKTLNKMSNNPLYWFENRVDFKDQLIKYLDSPVVSNELFETSMKQKQIVSKDDPVLFYDEYISPIYEKLSDIQKEKIKLWPGSITWKDEKGAQHSEPAWKHCGMEYPGKDENEIKISHNTLPNITTATGENIDYVFFYSLPTIYSTLTTYTSVDFTIDPLPPPEPEPGKERNVLKYIGDSSEIDFRFGSSFFDESQEDLTVKLDFDWKNSESSYNKELQKTADLSSILTIKVNDNVVEYNQSSRCYEFKLDKAKKEYKIVFTLNKEFVNDNSIIPFLSVLVKDPASKDYYERKSSSSAIRIRQINDPIEKPKEHWNTTDNCFKHKGDYVITEISANSLVREQVLIPESTVFSVIPSNGIPVQLEKKLIKTNDDITKYYLIDANTINPKTWFEVSFTRKELQPLPESPLKRWVTIVQITQVLDETFYGELSMRYSVDEKLASEFYYTWASGHPKPDPVPPVPPGPTPPGSSWWTALHIVGLVNIVMGTIALAMAIVANRKNKKLNSQIDKENKK